MDKGNSNTKNLIIASLVLVAIFVAGYFYSTRDRVSDADLLVGVPISGEDPIEGDLLKNLHDLKGLSLDENIFKNSIFKSLTDQSKPLSSQTSGRVNPFAPIETQSVFGITQPATSTR